MNRRRHLRLVPSPARRQRSSLHHALRAALGRVALVLVAAGALGLAACDDVTLEGLGARAPESAGAAGPACRVTRVIDGDTVDMRCDGATFRARLTGYDTPEVFSPGCREELRLGQAATRRLQALVRGARTTEARIGGTDRYGRRLVRLTLDGQDVATRLVSEGLAVRYGGGRRIDWCARLT